MRLFIAPILAIAFASLFTFDTASAAPATLPDRAIDIDLKQADVRNVLTMLGKIADREVESDACVRACRARSIFV